MTKLLERRYRRLLRWYPADYRRARGDEILATLLDQAAEGRTRPRVREVVDLTRHGLRCRLGRPASRTVAVWAALTAIMCGLFVAAASTRLAWQTARPEPNAAETRAVAAEALPGLEVSDLQEAGDRFHFDNSDGLPGLLFGLPLPDGPHASYERATTHAMIVTQEAVDADTLFATVRQRLRETGWRSPAPANWSAPCASGCGSGAADLRTTVLTARRGDTVVTLSISGVYPQPQDVADGIELRLYRATPTAVYVAAVVGGLLGAVAAWLLFAWASRRTGGHEGVKIFLGTTLLAWGFPVPLMVVAVGAGWPRLRNWPWPPMWEWLGQPALSGTFVLGSVTALLALAIAALSRPAPHATSQPAAHP